jgi:hypothetical protein
MFDLHVKNGNFRIRPTLFGLPSYTVFTSHGILAGIAY